MKEKARCECDICGPEKPTERKEKGKMVVGGNLLLLAGGEKAFGGREGGPGGA